MLTFFGGLVAYAIMSTSALPLTLHPLIWKQLVGDKTSADEKLTLADLKDIDEYASNALEDLLVNGQSMSEEMFEMAGFDLKFEAVLSNTKTRELC
jgi:hypothetical protein